MGTSKDDPVGLHIRRMVSLVIVKKESQMNPVFAFFEGMFAPSHIIIVLVVGVLVFGKRLPDIGGYLGRAIVSFRNSVRGLEEDLHPPVLPQQASATEGIRPPQRITASAPKFENGNPPKPAQPEV